MNYYSIQLTYPGPYGGGPTGTEDGDANTRFVKLVEVVDNLLNNCKLRWMPQHAWPDGQLYYYVTSMGDAAATTATLEDTLKGSIFTLANCRPQDGSSLYRAYAGSDQTLAEGFAMGGRGGMW